mgnify:CR=1 FL=1
MKWRQKKKNRKKIGERIQGGNDKLPIDFFKKMMTV